jgi:3-hydroxyisobutyrate dehydrogenase-like beta-hydroxyacid dehydrogenase
MAPRPQGRCGRLSTEGKDMESEEMRTVAVMAPGDMGHAVGRKLREGGLRVITCLQGRSARTAARAAEAGIADVPDDAALVREADVLLAILVPAQARALAERIAAAVRATGTHPLYVECNAIAPQTTRQIGDILTAAGARYVDAGIIGGPPAPGARGPRLYASGPAAPALARLRDHGLDVRVLGPEIGQASGLKMCYAALTKGLTALATEALAAGRALGLEEALRAELRESQGALLAWIERSVSGMPPKAARWVGEMEEIAATFGAVGLPAGMPEGAAALYRWVSATRLGDELPEVRQRDQTAEDVVALLAAALTRASPAARGPKG